MQPNPDNLRWLLAITLILGTGLALAAEPAATPVTGAVDTGGLWTTALRTIASLAAVLAVLAGCAWTARRLRDGGHLKSGMIEIVSGVSLGNREKVVLLRVGDDEVLVGVSPSGMQPLHVLNNRGQSAGFSKYMETAE